MTYGPVETGLNAWGLDTVAAACAVPNESNATTPDFGFKMFTTKSALWGLGYEGGMEFSAIPGTSIGQVEMNARASSSTMATMGGTSGTGTWLVWDFVGATGGSTQGKVAPTRAALLHTGFAATAQDVQKYRLGIRCEPTTSVPACAGPSDKTLVQDIVISVRDKVSPSISIEPTALSDGQWVKGQQEVKFTASDSESGLRESTVFIDDHQVSKKLFNCALVGGAHAGNSSIDMAKNWSPCPLTPQTETVSIDTSKFGDGVHTLKVCVRDFASWSPYWGEGAPICRQTNVRMDNSAPAAPEKAEAISTRIPRSVKPDDVTWADPGTGDSGSPIRKTDYEIVDQGGKVVQTGSVSSDGPADATANNPAANNVQAIDELNAPAGSGAFTLRVRVTDSVGHQSKLTTVPLVYSCVDSGGESLPESNIALGLVAPSADKAGASLQRSMMQGEKSDLVGKIRGPGSMPINGADLCVNAKPVTDPQLELLTKTETDGSGNFRTSLPAGPSRRLVAVWRQGHREVWSETANTEVQVKPTLLVAKSTIRAGQKLQFQGQIPGPHADRVVVVMRAKVGKAWQAFRRYRTRSGGKYKLTYRPRAGGLKRPTKFKVQTQVRYTVGYPYRQGDSVTRTITIKPKKKKKK